MNIENKNIEAKDEVEQKEESWKKVQSYKEIKEKSVVKNPIFCITKTENIWAILFTLVTVCVLLLLVETTDITVVTEVLKNLMLYIGAGLISMLGFIISGLAFASGTLSNEIIDKINEQGKFDSLQQILFSFWYIGRITGISIGLFFITYIIISINLPLNLLLFLCISIPLSYCFYYIIFYCVSLLKTCFNLFSVRFLYWKTFEQNK